MRLVAAIFLPAILLGLFLAWQVWSLNTPPTLIGQAPVEDHPELAFGPWGLARGAEVDTICTRWRPEGEFFFALRGRKATGFKTGTAGSYGDIVTDKGDPGQVYFYEYDEKYKNIVWTP